MNNNTTPHPDTRSWEFSHEFLSHPLVMDGLFSERVMLQFAITWLDANLPLPGGETWLIERDGFTARVI
jgi:hypothetical protein